MKKTRYLFIRKGQGLPNTFDLETIELVDENERVLRKVSGQKEIIIEIAKEFLKEGFGDF